MLLGDLNYRLTLPNLEVRWRVWSPNPNLTLTLSLNLTLTLEVRWRVWCREWRALLLHDELTCQLRSPGGGSDLLVISTTYLELALALAVALVPDPSPSPNPNSRRYSNQA